MTIYHINCSSPSSHLGKFNSGDRVHVIGKVRNVTVRADSVEDLTAKSGQCECSSQLPSAKAEGIEMLPKILPESFDKTGTVSNVKWGDGYLQFDLDVK